MYILYPKEVDDFHGLFECLSPLHRGPHLQAAAPQIAGERAMPHLPGEVAYSVHIKNSLKHSLKMTSQKKCIVEILYVYLL